MAAGDVETAITTNNGKRGASFDGVDDKITIGSLPSFRDAPTFTISLWLNNSWTGSADISIFCATDSTGLAILHGNGILEADKDIYCYMKTTGKAWTKFGGTGLFTEKIWNHILITHTSASSNLYINNSLRDTSNLFIGNLSTTGTYGFGDNNFNSLKGFISDCRIWDKVLSTEEITNVYNGQNVTDGLIHRWKLQEDYNDSVGTAHGTNSGTIFSIQDDAVASVIKANRTTANDKYLICGLPGGQVLSAVVEEAP